MSPYLLILVSYIAGSIPVGLYIGKVFFKKDVREFGSGNTGASNVGRTFGKEAGLAAFVLDVLKGMLPVLAARHWFPTHQWIQIVTGLAAIVGHNNSVFLKFTGGKGVATSCGVAIALSWKAASIGMLLWIAVTYATGFISLGSIVSTPVTGFLIWQFNGYSLPYGLFGLLVAITVIYKHRGNIKRLIAGNENSIRGKKSGDRQSDETAKTAQLILASASPRRKELLAELGVTYDVVHSTVDESALIESFGVIEPQDLAKDLAMAKASDVLSRNPTALVVGADTIVVLDGDVLGKPVDEVDAARMLALLSGKTHKVYTGIAVVSQSRHDSAAICTDVTFKRWTADEIAAYIATGEPLDKAGAYGIQNAAISPVASIEGDYYNVVGLPLEKLRELLVSEYPKLKPAPSQPDFSRR